MYLGSINRQGFTSYPWDWELFRSYLAYKSGNHAHAIDILQKVDTRKADLTKVSNLRVVLLVESGQVGAAVNYLNGTTFSKSHDVR